LDIYYVDYSFNIFAFAVSKGFFENHFGWMRKKVIKF